MSDVKFTVKTSGWEVSYEGSEEFLRDTFRSALENLFESEIWGNLTPPVPDDTFQQVEINPQMNGAEPRIPQMTVKAVCAKLGVQSGPQLLLAACAYLTLIKGQDKLSRRDILQTMREASGYYKETLGSNLSQYLLTLQKGKQLMESTPEVYVLSAAAAKEMEAVLVQQ